MQTELKIRREVFGVDTLQSVPASLIISSGTGAIVLKDFAATTFNVNGEAYRISGNKLIKNS